MTFLDRLNSPKLDFTQNRSGGNIIKYQQNQALTSHFESFWSIVVSSVENVNKQLKLAGFFKTNESLKTHCALLITM